MMAIPAAPCSIATTTTKIKSRERAALAARISQTDELEGIARPRNALLSLKKPAIGIPEANTELLPDCAF